MRYSIIALSLIAFCGGLSAMAPRPALPTLPMGDLSFHNTLNEPVQIQFQSSMTGRAGNSTFVNNRISGGGTIPANSTGVINSLIRANNASVWGNSIVLNLRALVSNQTRSQIVNHVGMYIIFRNTANELELAPSGQEQEIGDL